MRVVAAHSADQLADVFGNVRPTALSDSDLPPPERAAAPPISGDYGCTLDVYKSRRPVAPDSAQPRPQEPMRAGQLRLFAGMRQEAELLPKHESLHQDRRAARNLTVADAPAPTGGVRRQPNLGTEAWQVIFSSHAVRAFRQAQMIYETAVLILSTARARSDWRVAKAANAEYRKQATSFGPGQRPKSIPAQTWLRSAP